MTLLESVLAFVILAVVGVACLDLSRSASALERSSQSWTEAVARGEAALAAGAASVPEGDDAVSVSRRHWRDGVDLVEVRVSVRDGRELHLARLVATPRTAMRR